MTHAQILLYFVIYALGIIIGYHLHKLRKCDGELVVDTSNDATDRWLFNLSTPIMDVYRKRTISLNVVHRKITEEDKWPKEN